MNLIKKNRHEAYGYLTGEMFKTKDNMHTSFLLPLFFGILKELVKSCVNCVNLEKMMYNVS